MILHDLYVKTALTNLRTISDNFRTGKWIAFSKWLQRLEQEKKWTAGDKKKAKSYLNRLLSTSGAIQGFLVCNIEFLISNINQQKEEQPNLANLWEEMIDWLKEKQALGATDIVLDGQNRLKFAIVGFMTNKLGINLNIDGEEKSNVFYQDLDTETKKQVDEHQVLLSIAVGGNIVSVVQSLIAINEGEPWGPNEKRSVMLTPISYHINRLGSHPSVVALNKKLKGKVFSGEKYALEKKGDIRFIAEHLHYLRNGKPGSETSLTAMYNAKDEKIKGQLARLDKMFLWISKYLSQKLIDKIESKEVYRDLYLFTSMLTDNTVTNSQEVNYNIPLKQIQSPEIYLEKVIDSVKEMLADKSQFVASTDKKGNTVYKVADAKPQTFYVYHKNSTDIDLRGRERLFMTTFNKILDECVNEGVIVTENPRKIDKFTKMQVEQKYNGDIYERYPTENLETLNGKEIDHFVSVRNYGLNDVENLNYTAKSHNRKLGAK